MSDSVPLDPALQQAPAARTPARRGGAPAPSLTSVTLTVSQTETIRHELHMNNNLGVLSLVNLVSGLITRLPSERNRVFGRK